MSGSLIWSRKARKEMERLDSRVKRRVSEALDRYLETGTGDVVALKGQLEGESRLKVGDWRVRFVEFDNSIEITRVVHRSQAYDVREPFEEYVTSGAGDIDLDIGQVRGQP